MGLEAEAEAEAAWEEEPTAWEEETKACSGNNPCPGFGMSAASCDGSDTLHGVRCWAGLIPVRPVVGLAIPVVMPPPLVGISTHGDCWDWGSALSFVLVRYLQRHGGVGLTIGPGFLGEGWRVPVRISAQRFNITVRREHRPLGL